VEAIIASARKLIGSPYLWGGASVKAADCSGFTKLLYYSRGIILARDASQQVKYGQPVDISNLENLEKGDLLFFGDSAEKPGHVGLHLGHGDFIHASGRVHISSILPGNPKHDPERKFVAARRIIGSLDTEGIVKVGSHDWYSSKGFRLTPE
jgi:cell wall-associated NlpC family hydrolase